MAYSQITSVKDSDSILLGLGTLGITSTLGSPATFADVGYIKGCEVTYTREFREFTSAGLLVKRLVFSDRLELNAEWAEVSISNLQTVFAPGASAVDEISFGGSKTVTQYRVQFEHQRSDNYWLALTIWKAVPSGEFTLAFAEEEFIQYPVQFAAEVDDAKAAGAQYARIRIHEP